MDLSSYTVLEVGEYVAAPYAGKLFSDLGADVLKVEPPEGEIGRHVGPFDDETPDANASGFFGFLNTGKRSVTLARETAVAPGVIESLVAAEGVDVVIEEELVRYGVDPCEFADGNDSLSVISISGFGDTGPFREYAAPDLIAWAESGHMNKAGYPESQPTRPRLKSTDYWTGEVAALCALSALLYRDLQGGSGQFVDVPKREVALSALEYFIAGYSWSGETTQRTGDGYPDQGTQYGFPTVFPAADGHFSAAVTTPGVWEVFCEYVLERPELVDDERFATQDARQDNLDAVEEIVREYTRQHEKWEMLETFQELGIPCAVTTEPREVVEFEQLEARDFWQDVPLPNGTTVTMPGFPFRPDLKEVAMSRAPRLGEHNESVYAGLDYDLEQLASTGAI